MPKLSIIIPVYNAYDQLLLCLKAIQQSSYKDYEIIVIDDGSTRMLYKNEVLGLTNQFIEIKENKGPSYARNLGVREATGEVIVNVDADIIIFKDTLNRIVHFFDAHPEVDALTGLLSKQHPHQDFFSQYKNLYMNYVFKRLPDRINFIYSSICAFRKHILPRYDHNQKMGEDTELGQRLYSQGKEIAFLRDLEVIHMKKYNLSRFIKNDFLIPFYWGKVFIKHQGWKQLGKNKTGFAHSSQEQLLSLIAAFLIMFVFTGSLFYEKLLMITLIPIIFWLYLNVAFIRYLTKEKGIIFGILSLIVTFFDNLIMTAGVISGLSVYSKKY